MCALPGLLDSSLQITKHFCIVFIPLCVVVCEIQLSIRNRGSDLYVGMDVVEMF